MILWNYKIMDTSFRWVHLFPRGQAAARLLPGLAAEVWRPGQDDGGEGVYGRVRRVRVVRARGEQVAGADGVDGEGLGERSGKQRVVSDVRSSGGGEGRLENSQD